LQIIGFNLSPNFFVLKRAFYLIFSLIVLTTILFISAKPDLSSSAAFDIPDYGVITISSSNDHQLIAVSGDIHFNEKYDNGRVIAMHKSTTSTADVAPWAKWHIIYSKTLKGTRYYQIRNVFSGKLLEAKGKSVVQQKESKSDDNNQLWQIMATRSSGQYLIKNKAANAFIVNTAGKLQLSAAVAKNNKAAVWEINNQPDLPYRDDEVVNFFNRNLKSQGSVAFDEGTSIPLTWGANAGKVLWVTQDAWDGIMLQPNGMFKCKDFFNYGNSMFLQPAADNWSSTAAPNIIREGSAQGKPRQIVDIQPKNSFAWPGPGVEIGNKVYVHVGEGNGLNPENQSLWMLTESADTLWQAQRTLPSGVSGQVEILYSTGMVKADDGFVYSFGVKGTAHGYGSNLHVARFPVSNPQQWSFWNGNDWAEKPAAAEAARITEGKATCYVSYLNGKYILMTMDQGFLCDDKRNIYIATADKPTGPFTPLKKVYEIREYLYGKYARYYTPAIHPQAVNGRNELLLTYCLNFSGCGIGDCKGDFMDPYFYRVKAIRVPYKMIGL
jgi:hypothetical protein